MLRRAVAWFAARGVHVERVISDNGSCYKSKLWRQTCTELGITVKHTRPYRPQTNGKAERFNRTLADKWAFARLFPTETHRRKALPAWLHEYNHHRPHTAIGKLPPISRLTNLPGQYRLGQEPAGMPGADLPHAVRVRWAVGGQGGADVAHEGESRCRR